MNAPHQAQGLLGAMVDRMIRQSVRRAFYAVYWSPPPSDIPHPCIFVPNHHGWHDGYVMYLALTRLNAPFLDWIAEYDAFPLFGRVGGMRFPPNDAPQRAITIRKTIREMRQGRNLLLFAEAELHRPPDLLPFGESLRFIAEKVPAASIVPVGIRYVAGLHERPEAFVSFGAAIAPQPNLLEVTRGLVQAELLQIDARLREPDHGFEVLHPGTKDVNQRMDMRKFQFWRRDNRSKNS